MNSKGYKGIHSAQVPSFLLCRTIYNSFNSQIATLSGTCPLILQAQNTSFPTPTPPSLKNPVPLIKLYPLSLIITSRYLNRLAQYCFCFEGKPLICHELNYKNSHARNNT